MEIVSVNNVEIQCPVKEGMAYVAIKPICQALGIDPSSQIRDIKDDPILASTVVYMTTVGGDEKSREMVCLPVRYVFGWLFRISADRVKPEVRESLLKYQRECYDAIYDHFYMLSARYEHKENLILQRENKILELKLADREIKTEIKKLEKEIDDIRNTNVRQLELDLK